MQWSERFSGKHEQIVKQINACQLPKDAVAREGIKMLVRLNVPELVGRELEVYASAVQHTSADGSQGGAAVHVTWRVQT